VLELNIQILMPQDKNLIEALCSAQLQRCRWMVPSSPPQTWVCDDQP
jgi:hypothetical protein